MFLSPRTIYNFYFLYTFLQTRGTDQYSGFLVNEFAQNIKKTYLRVFEKLLKSQLEKYDSRRRVDADFKIIDNLSLTQIFELMKKTFRSDMKRRNDRWIDLAKWVVELENVSDTKSIFHVVDRINNTTHNTHELILSKFENARELMTTFNTCHEMPSLEGFRPFIAKEYAKLL